MDTKKYSEGFLKLIEALLKSLLFDGLSDFTKETTDTFIERFVAEEAGKCSVVEFNAKFSTIERSLTFFLEYVDSQNVRDRH